MEESEVFEATTADGFAPILEVLKDQEFQYANLHHDPKARTLAISLEKKFPPKKGNWVLEWKGVGGVKIDHQANHTKDTLRGFSFDAERGLVVVKCVLDEIRIHVDSLDLTARRFGGEDPGRKWRYEDLPEKIRKEIDAERAATAADQERAAGARRGLVVKAAVSMAAVSLVLGAVQVVAGGGRAFIDFVVLPLVTGATSWFCIATGRDQLTTCLVVGGPAFLTMCIAMTVLHQGTLLIAFCGGLVHIVLAQVLVIWIRGEKEMKI